MNHIKPFHLFETKEDVLYIFDFDDTLVNSPHFEELAIEYLKEDVSIKTLLDKSLAWINKTESDLKIEHGRLYVEDPNSEIVVKGNWVRKKTRVYLVSPDRFYYTDLSFPKSAKKLSEFYNSVKNKAIVTARIKTVKSKVEEYMEKLGIETPNWGLYCYPSRSESTDKVAMWKGKKIVELIKESGFTKVKFYDDKSKIVNAVTKAVKTHLPNIEFEGIKVKS